MPIDLLALAADLIAGEGLELVKDKAKRQEGVLRVLTKLGFKLDAPPANDFDGVYAYTLVVYGIDKPKPIHEFFRHQFIKNAFRRSFETRDTSYLDEESENFLDWSAIAKELLSIYDYDPRQEIAEFQEYFTTAARLTRTVQDILVDQTLEDISNNIQKIPTKEDLQVNLAPITHKLDMMLEVVENPLGKLAAHTELLEEIKKSTKHRGTTSPYLYLKDFIGRKKELSDLRKCWDAGVKNVLIYGLAGIGKSSLVSYFLEHELKLPSQKVFRNDFRLTSDFSSFARYLGNFLSIQPPTSDSSHEYVSVLLDALNENDVVLFFDNFEEVLREIPDDKVQRSRPLKVKDQYLSIFIESLLKIQTGVNIYITSRYKPDFGVANANCVEIPEANGLSGLDENESRELLYLRKGDATVNEIEWQNIHQLIKGHPAATELLGQILKDRVFEVKDLLTKYDEANSEDEDSPFIEVISEDLFDTIYSRLSQLEQLSLRRLSILRLSFDHTALIALASLTSLDAKETIDLLWKKSLLQRKDVLYEFHPLLQKYTLNLIDTNEEEKNEAHILAGEYYLLLDQSYRPWQNDGDVNYALESVHHLEFSNQEFAHTLLEEVFSFLQDQGQSFYIGGNYAASERTVRKRIFELEPRKYLSSKNQRLYGRLYFYLANLLTKQNKLDEETRKCFQISIEFAENYIYSWQAWAIMEHNLGNNDRARELFQKAAEIGPNHTPVWQAWAIMEHNLGNNDRARELFQKAAEIGPKQIPVWHAWGIMEKELENYNQARELFQKAIEINPAHILTWHAWGIMEKELENYDQARELFQKAIGIDPTHISTWYRWALMESELGNYDKARNLFQKTLELDSKNINNWQTWINMESKIDNQIYVYKILEETADIGLSRIKILREMAMREQKLGNYKLAREVYKIATGLDDNYTPTLRSWASMEYEVGNKETALTLIQKAIGIDPSYATAWRLWANIEFDLENHERARLLIQKSIDVNPRDEASWRSWANIENNLGNYNEARTLMQKAIDINPKHAPTWQAWAIMECGLKNYDRARELFRKANDVDPKHAPTLQSWAIMERDLGNLIQARDLFQKTAEVHPQDPRNFQDWAILEGELGNFPLSRKLFKTANKLGPKNPITLQSWAVMEARSHKYEIAIKLLLEALELKPKEPFILQALGIAYANNKDLSSARKYFTQATNLEPHNHKIWCAWGQAEVKFNNYQPAEKYLQRTVELAPKDGLGWSILGDVLRHQNQLDRAEECYTNAIAFSDNKYTTMRASLEKAKMLSRIDGRSQDAIAAFKSILDLDPANLEAHKRFGEFYYWQKQYKEAEQEYRSALDIDPNNDYILTSLAGILARQNGRDKESEELFEKALKINPKSSRTCKHYGNFLYWRKRNAEALKFYKLSLSLHDDSQVRQKIEKIRAEGSG